MIWYGVAWYGVMVSTFGQEVSGLDDLPHFGDDRAEHHRPQQHGHDRVCPLARVGRVNVA